MMSIFRRERSRSNGFPCEQDDKIVLVSKSLQLCQDLRGIANEMVQGIEDLPKHCQLKGVIIDAEYARPGKVRMFY